MSITNDLNGVDTMSNRGLFSAYGMTIIALAVFVSALNPVLDAVAATTQATGEAHLVSKKRLTTSATRAFQKLCKETAVLSGWKNYTATFGTSQSKTYMNNKDHFLDKLDDFIVNTSIIEEEINRRQRSCDMVVRITINVSAVDATFDQIVTSGVKASGGGGNTSFIFVSRQVLSVKKYDDKKTTISEEEGASSEKQESVVTQDETEESESHESRERTTTGGSTETKADKILYEVTSSQDIDAAMGKVLSSSGYEIILYDDVVTECGGPEPSLIRKEFSDHDEMSRKTRAAAIASARSCDISYFSVGTIDVGQVKTDPVTGQQRVFVSVRGQVWDITQRFPKKVASVGPVQYSGLGPDISVARRNALVLASKKAARSIVSQLSAKGLY